MFGLFKRKSEVEVLQEQYSKLMKQSHKLSTTNRAESDEMFAKAELIAKKIEALKKS